MEDLQSRLKAATALVQGGGAVGTGYLVTPALMATCAHVVPKAHEGDAVTLRFGYPGPAVTRSATLRKSDPQTDCAILVLDIPLMDRAPLELSAEPLSANAPWFTFGYPAISNDDGSNFAGVIDDPDGRKDGKRTIVLYSEKVAAGMATGIQGLSGSPVMVGRAVVGHVASVRPDRDFQSRAAFGEVFASPILGVQRLLAEMGQLPAPAAPPPARLVAATPSDLGDRKYHAFISYRSTDRLVALDLVERLEARALKIYIDQQELMPGDELAASLQTAIGESQAAVVLVSRSWLASPWCREEMNALLHQAVEKNVRVIPVRVDDCEMPPMLASRIWIDLAGAALIEGEALERIAAALGCNVRPAASPPAHAPQSPVTAFSRIEAGGRDLAEMTLTSAEALLSIGEPHAALKLLAGAGHGTRARQLRALGLSRTGNVEDAIAELDPLAANGQLLDHETGGILGGRYKARWVDTGDVNCLHKAFRIYRGTFERTGHLYPGVNVLALGLYLRKDKPALLGEADLKQLASIGAAVEAESTKILEDDHEHWRLATRAEVLLLRGNLEGARRFYGLAASAKPEARADVAVMRRQARRNLRYLELAEDSVDDVLEIPAVAAFTGHMTDAPGRESPRLPESKVGALRAAVRALLKRHRIGYGFSSAARGSDIVFIEEMLARGGRVKIFLPFPAEAFCKTSVETEADDRWRARFDELVAQAAKDDTRVDMIVVSERVPPDAEKPRAYAACNLAIQNAAKGRAQLLDQKPLLIAVWNGEKGKGAGGAGDAVRDWRDSAIGEVEVVNPSSL